MQDKLGGQTLLRLVVSGHIVGQNVAVVVLLKAMATEVEDAVDTRVDQLTELLHRRHHLYQCQVEQGHHLSTVGSKRDFFFFLEQSLVANLGCLNLEWLHQL